MLIFKAALVRDSNYGVRVPKYGCLFMFVQYLSQHGGTDNAFTSREHTNYFFDVAPDHLAGALDR